MSANRFIKKSTVSVRNSPVSTFRFNAASGKRFANEIEQQGNILQKTALVEGEKIAKKNAKEIAMGLDSSKIITTDDEGKPIALQMDLGLGSIGRETFQSAIDQRYVQEWDKKLKLKANEIYNSSLLEEHPNAVFKTRMSTFIEEHVNSVEDSFYNGIVKNIGSEYQAEYSQKYQINKVQRQIQDITLTKTEAVEEAGRAYLDSVRSFGINHPRTIEQKQFLETRQNDPLYERLASPAERLTIKNQNKINLAGLAHEKIIQYITSGRFTDQKMKSLHQSLGIYSESNIDIKKLKKEHPEIANEIRTLYANTDDIGFKNERDKLQNASGGLITAASNKFITASNLEVQSTEIKLREESIISEGQLNNKISVLFNETRNTITQLGKSGDFDAIDKHKEVYKLRLANLTESFLKHSVVGSSVRKLAPDQAKLLLETEQSNKNIVLKKLNIQNTRNIDRQFENLKLQGKLEYHLSNQELGTLYEGFTNDYLTYLQTGEEKFAGNLPDDLITSIDLIRNGAHWVKHQDQIIQDQTEYFSKREQKIKEAEINHTSQRTKEFNEEQNELLQLTVGIATNTFTDDMEDLPPELTAGKSLSEARLDTVNSHLDLMFEQMDSFASLSTTSNDYKESLEKTKSLLKDSVYQEVFNSYVSNIDGTTQEGLNQLINLQGYFEDGSAFKKTKLLDNNNLSAVENIYNEISETTQTEFIKKVEQSIASSVQNSAPSQAEINQANAVESILRGGVYNPDKFQEKAMQDIFDSTGSNLTDDWSNKTFTELSQISTMLKQNFVPKQIIGQLDNFVNNSLSPEQSIRVFENLQKLTSHIGDQGSPFNIEINKIFANQDQSDLATDIETILIGANVLKIPTEEIPKFISDYSNFNLKGDDNLQFKNKETYKEIYDQVRLGLSKGRLFESQIDQALGAKASNFIIERLSNLVLNAETMKGDSEYSLGTKRIQKLVIKGLIDRVNSEFAPNNPSEALITGQVKNTHSNNNVMATFPEKEKQKSFFRTISSELGSMVKPMDSNKKYVLAEDFEQTMRAFPAGTDKERYRNSHIPVYITPNFMVNGRYPMYMAMMQDKNNNLVPVIAKHLLGEQEGENGYVTWDSENWDRQWNVATAGGVNDFSQSWDVNENKFIENYAVAGTLSGNEFNISAEKGYSYPTDRDN